MQPLDNFRVFDWVRLFIQVIMVPFAVYVIITLEALTIKTALIEKTMEIRSQARDKQVDNFLDILKDHESRIRLVEKQIPR